MGWKEREKVKLSDRLEFLYGFSVRVNEENEGEYPVYGSNGITGFIDNYKINGPGIVIGRKGSVGKVSFSKNHFTPTDTAYYVQIKDNTKDDLKFWFYYLPLLGLEKLNTHSSVPGLSREIAYLIEVNPPNLPTQTAIARVLSSLDDKIEINNKINKELENMAKTIYDYWFVQNADKRWERKSLFDIATFSNGLACQKFRSKGKEFYRVIKIKEMRDGFTKDTELVDTDIPKNVIVNDGDILFSWSASLEVMIWAGGIGGLNQHIFKVTSDKYPKSFVYFQLLHYLNRFRAIANNRRTTMGHITTDHLKQSEIHIPPPKIIMQVDKAVSPLFSAIIKNRQENICLAQQRDFLLPLLMGGEVGVG